MTSIRRSLVVIGNVARMSVFNNNPHGGVWLAAIDVAEQTVMAQFPEVNGISISGSIAHQSSTVGTHSNVLSVKFYAGEQRVISGHIHMNGAIEYSNRASGSRHSSSKWKPARDMVDQVNWVIYDTEKKKNRNVYIEGKWWFVKKGADKLYF